MLKRLIPASLIALGFASAPLHAANIYDMADTWTDAGTTYTAIKMNVTDTSSNAASLLLDLQVGGTTKFNVVKDGRVVVPVGSASTSGYFIGAASSAGIYSSSVTSNLFLAVNGAAQAQVTVAGIGVSSAHAYSWGTLGSGQDVLLYRDAAAVLALRNSTNAQAFRVYNTDGATDDEYLSLAWASNIVKVTPAIAGGGTLRGLIVGSGRIAATVDSATTFAVTSQYMLLSCTGAETINTITGGVTGMELSIDHTDTECTIADDDDATAADAVDLTGTGTNDAGAVNKNITLRYNGTYWVQSAESDN
jgi:hypothetical protein